MGTLSPRVTHTHSTTAGRSHRIDLGVRMLGAKTTVYLALQLAVRLCGLGRGT